MWFSNIWATKHFSQGSRTDTIKWNRTALLTLGWASWSLVDFATPLHIKCKFCQVIPGFWTLLPGLSQRPCLGFLFYNVGTKLGTGVQEGQGKMIHRWTEKVHHGFLNENPKFPNPPGRFLRARKASRVFFLIACITRVPPPPMGWAIVTHW